MMRDFMSMINATIELDDNGVPPSQWQDDHSILDLFLDSDRFTKAQIRRLNYFRLFLQAVTLSDLTDASDERLDQSKLHGVFNV